MGHSENTLVIGDTHLPYEHPLYLEFIMETKREFKCKRVVHIGDIVDNHTFSRFPHDPSGHSPFEEYNKALTHLTEWKYALPEMTVIKGNHDDRIMILAVGSGIPESFMRTFTDIFEFPDTWTFVDSLLDDNDVLYTHKGKTGGGKTPHLIAASSNGLKTVIGHHHERAGVDYLHLANEHLIWGLSTGCGIDKNSFAFAYADDPRPILGCGVVLDNGKFPQFIPMRL